MGVLAESSSRVGWPTAAGSAVVLFALAAVFIVVGLKQRKGTLKPNQLVGYRTRTTMANDATWYAAHSASAVYTIASGAVLLIAGVVLLTNPTRQVATAAAGTASVLTFGLIIAGAFVSQTAAKAALQHETNSRDQEGGIASG